MPLDKTLVPPLVSKVQPTMEAVKKIWIDPYIKVAGEDFIKIFCPKQYVTDNVVNRMSFAVLGAKEKSVSNLRS